MFFGNHERSRARRRGVVLILILGMLALMALIGVTFATFAGQSLVGNRNFAQAVNFPGSEQVMDYALAQLINDTNNPLSSLRGHSLLRDMYGNDSLLNANAASFRAQLKGLPGAGPLLITNEQAYPGTVNTVLPSNDLTNYIQVQTNIPVNSFIYPALYGINFSHWILTLNSGGGVPQTFEILEDDNFGTSSFSNGFHVFTLSEKIPGHSVVDPLDSQNNPVTRVYSNPNTNYINQTGSLNALTTPQKQMIFMDQLPHAKPANNANITFSLDGRFMRAFNGPGMSMPNYVGYPDATFLGAGQPHNNAAYANFRVNHNLLVLGYNHNSYSPTSPPALGTTATPALGDPAMVGMDEDYDACDLENWFLALQSADGQVMIPSFHRPGILTAHDWTTPYSPGNVASVMSTAKILRPRQVDNSALFPADPLPNPLTGRINYDIDNDGDGVTDSVWLDLGFPVQKDPRGQLFKPLFAFMVIGLNGRMPLNTAGNLQSRDFQTITKSSASGTASPAPFPYDFLPATYLDGSTWDHASHLGFSVNEINPHFALQNAPNSVYGTGAGGGVFSQIDNAGMTVDTVQLRNLLAGTVPPDANLNFDHNTVFVNGLPVSMGNSVYDATDTAVNGVVTRGNAPVPGRWGEPSGVPRVLSVPIYSKTATLAGTALVTPIHSMIYTNPVRAGRSVANLFGSPYGTTVDGMDDDFDADDFFPFPPSNPPNTHTSYGEGYVDTTTTPTTSYGDYYDIDGSIQLPVERIRRFVTPIDPAGVGRVVAWNERPLNIYDFGQGTDNYGRAGFFRYFRPAGMPKTVTYDNTTINTLTTSATPIDNYNGGHGYNQPILTGPTIPDNTNNLLHGWQANAAPFVGIGGGGDGGVAVMAAMPYDWTNATTAAGDYAFNTPGGYPMAGSPAYPGFTTTNLSTMSHYVNTSQGPFLRINSNATTPDTLNYPPVATGTNPASGASVVNGYATYPSTSAGSSLNKDEADEMNLYSPSFVDMPYGQSDLEWLYRMQDIDGAYLTSRLSQLAPVSFLNNFDGTTRRRLFSTDSWETNNFAYAPDNPSGAFPWNSRFNQVSNGSLELINYNVNGNANGASLYQTYVPPGTPGTVTQNTNTVNYLKDVLQYPPSIYGSLLSTYPFTPATGSTPSTTLLPPIATPAIAHRDRKINLNYPLPLSNDPAEPIRQKCIREMYQMFKAILPPQAIDTPQELAGLSQYCVNIVDFRDPDCSATRFVNTDLIVTPATTSALAVLAFADRVVPTSSTSDFIHFPYDPSIYDEQVNPKADWTSQMQSTVGAVTLQFLVQHGMEYNPVALNEALAYTYPTKSNGNFTRLAFELLNTLTDDGTVNNASATSTSDLTDTNLDGWDIVVTDDSTACGRPDPTTGDIPAAGLAAAITAKSQAIIVSSTPPPGAPTPPTNSFSFTPTKYLAAMQANGPSRNSTATYFQVGTSPGTMPAGQEKPAFLANDSTLPTTFAMPMISAGQTKFCWLYLRRPANPFDQRPWTTREMIVVDSIRFPYSFSDGKGTPATPTDTVTTGKIVHYSTRRYQPFRGGHAVDTTVAGGVPTPSYAWGYSEQSEPPSTATTTTAYYGNNTGTPLTQPIYHTMGTTAATRTLDTPWGYFPFHDRDFTSPAELLIVPGCPPGLFTKQFIESNNPNAPVTAAILSSAPQTTLPTTGFGTNLTSTASPPNIHSYPYLNDEFFYTAASVVPFTNPPTSASPYPTKIGNYTGDGWYKILEFVEVPSSANGAFGPVASGTNFDWLRQDRKPGLLNLNLIIDEEVFFGLFDDHRLNTSLATLPNPYTTGNAFTTPSLPQIVSQIDYNGYPASLINPLTPNQQGYYPISTLPNGRGYVYFDQTGLEVHGMKSAFSDFLKLRSGGSGFLYAWGSGGTGSGPVPLTVLNGNTITMPGLGLAVAEERPFHSLSYPDINLTVMRPATLPPSPLTNPPLTYGPVYSYQDDAGTPTALPVTTPVTTYVGDPGVRNPFLGTTPGKRHVPLVPLRRLFQVPDVNNTGGGASGSAEYINPPGTTPVATTLYGPNQPIIHEELSNNFTANLFSQAEVIDLSKVGAAAGTTGTVTYYLGAGYDGTSGYNGSSNNDYRQHPYYRTEILQKVMNLTTVRTHQFAVWITVGFFEVVNTGSPVLGIADQLGPELGLLAGKNIRYRSFFLLDRTKAVGFDAFNPIDFRDVVTYRRRIE